MNAAHLYAVLLGGSIAGALDILFAISFAAYQGATPVRLLQTVASGLLGSAAFAGGLPVAALGLALHFAISLLWAGLFLALALRLPALTLHPLLAGVLFGAMIFLAMRLLVLPLSAFPYPVSFKPLATVLDLLSHMLLFGVPIAWAAQRALLVATAKA
ncbi:hypothetical protein PFX98_07060 [Paucibacter sediminis]|uniref:DUF1440 domain-containing protein n=1 Tax=Paucibacter sediminis TaxID=3019553 RepID=A0AA95NGY7_9BURK|nr:hypothetical protein [Paucibacter sp. S2-9]WIT13363.1 hypothetical protein PFX98_07060 [Paucibacter sp. S2-9]